MSYRCNCRREYHVAQYPLMANALVGGMIGIAGLAGFLLHILYNGFLGLPLVDSLVLSFLAPVPEEPDRGPDGAGLGQLIPQAGAKLLLHSVVFASGLFILLKKEPADGGEELTGAVYTKRPLLLLVSLVTATACSPLIDSLTLFSSLSMIFCISVLRQSPGTA